MSRHPIHRRAHRRPTRPDRPPRQDGPNAWLKALRPREPEPPIWTLLDSYDPVTERPIANPKLY